MIRYVIALHNAGCNMSSGDGRRGSVLCSFRIEFPSGTPLFLSDSTDAVES